MPPATGPGKKKKRSANEDDLEEWRKAKTLQKPKDQIDLPEAELREIIARVLVVNNPQVPTNLVEFDYNQGHFVPIPPAGNMVVLMERKSTLLYKDSEEARQQMLDQGINPEDLLDDVSSIMEPNVKESTTTQVSEPEVEKADSDDKKSEDEEEKHEGEEGEEGEGGEKAEGEGDEGEEGKDAEEEVHRSGGKPKKLTNQFNFCERAAMTYNNPTRSHETQTTPPPMATFSGQVKQFIIYDSYQVDFAAQQLEKELEREKKEKEKAPVSRHAQPTAPKKHGRSQMSEVVQGRCFQSWKVLERMVNQNTYMDIAKDFRYWDDPADEYREEEGTLLPLWKFLLTKTKRNTVTDLIWNPWYYDMFAVCLGYLDFMKPIPEGAVCLFTLKNPSYPEHICMTDSCVMCVDIHPKYPYMVVIGQYDGSVVVFNVQISCKEPAFKSNNVTNKHAGIVWQVNWAPDLPDGEMNFYSVAADGKVNNWVLMQNELAVTTIFMLYLSSTPVPGPDGTLARKIGCASCVIFHPQQPLIYLVGTEEGYIYKCSTEYSSTCLLSFRAHHMPIYRIDFNKFNPDIFVSCSGDWRIKIWEDNRLEPLFVFDVGACVGDVKWAPYSSTVLAAVTTEGRVYVFDLNLNKYKPICIQAVVAKKRHKLTRIAFNYKLPIIIVGDDKGCVTTLKLSPNLRIPCKAPKKQQNLDQFTLQCMKLDKLLSLVREPLTLTIPSDPAESEGS